MEVVAGPGAEPPSRAHNALFVNSVAVPFAVAARSCLLGGPVFGPPHGVTSARPVSKLWEKFGVTSTDGDLVVGTGSTAMRV